MTQGHGNGIHDGLAETAQHEQQDGDTLDEDDSHGSLPTESHGSAERVRDDGVDAHARGAGERTVRDEAHRDRHDRGTDARGGHRGGDGNATGGEDERVHDDDVRHRQERGQSRTQLSGHVGLALPQLEKLVHR